MAQDKIFSAVTAHFHAFHYRHWISDALQNGVSAITAREFPDCIEACGWLGAQGWEL